MDNKLVHFLVKRCQGPDNGDNCGLETVPNNGYLYHGSQNGTIHGAMDGKLAIEADGGRWSLS
jgi:hypothetical protein